VAAGWNGSGGAINTVEYSGWESDSRTVEMVLGLKRVGWNSSSSSSRAVNQGSRDSGLV